LALLFTNPVSLILMAITICCINVVMFGVAMKQSDIAITEASLPNIMMISIIAFSHCIHFEFGFAFYQGTRLEKAIDAIWSHGTAIAYTSLCTLLGSLPLIASASGLDIVFFLFLPFLSFPFLSFPFLSPTCSTP